MRVRTAEAVSVSQSANLKVAIIGVILQIERAGKLLKRNRFIASRGGRFPRFGASHSRRLTVTFGHSLPDPFVNFRLDKTPSLGA
jgi:hypothetical protein